jgi:hypothetical protein
MLEINLEPTDARARPAFIDKPSCEIWLQQLQLTNLHQAHGILRSQLDEFNRYPISGFDRFNTLELLRETLALVQADYAKKLISKKLPFSDDSMAIFVSIIALWRGILKGYQRCLKAYLDGEKQLEKSAAILTQRCMRYIGLQIFEHQRSGYEFETNLWQQLHSLYAFAEKNEFQLIEVKDDLHSHKHPSNCQSVWVKALLVSHAHPDELTRGQLQMLDRWLDKWSNAIEVSRKFTITEVDAPPLAVDLWSSQGLQGIKIISNSGEMRYFAMVPLSKLLRVRCILLQQGQSPQQLELGDCNSVECAEFLNTLHQYLCEPNSYRQAERHTVEQTADLCYGLDAIYAHISLKPFRRDSREVGADTMGLKQLITFGRVLSDTNRQKIVDIGFNLESWHIENESISGANLLREELQGERIGAHQIVALKAEDANAFMIGKISWVVVTLKGKLRMGIQYFPGLAQPISIQNKGLNANTSNRPVPALLLPAVPVLKTPPSLIVPRNFFQPNIIAEIIDLEDKAQSVKLGFSVIKGLDFERVSFTPA